MSDRKPWDPPDFDIDDEPEPIPPEPELWIAPPKLIDGRTTKPVVGQVVSFTDCYGLNKKTGTIVDRNLHSSIIRVGDKNIFVADCLLIET